MEKLILNKKVVFSIAVIALMLFLPMFSGQAVVTPDDLNDSSLITSAGDGSTEIAQPDGTYVVNGTTIEVNSINSDETEVILNNTYKVHITQAPNVFQADFYEMSGGGGPHIEADTRILGVTVATYETNTTVSVYISSFGEIKIINKGPDTWMVELPDLVVHYDGTVNSLVILTPDYVIIVDEHLITINSPSYMPIALEKYEERFWRIHVLAGIMNVTYFPTRYFAPNDNLTVTDDLGNVIFGPAKPVPFNIVNPTGVTFTFQDEVLVISYLYWTVSFYPDFIVLQYFDIAITLYFDYYGILERVIILILDFTFVFYYINVLIELYFVIIYYDFEIKFYYTQVVIVCQTIEIVIVFISITLWEITIIWHIDVWLIQIVILIQLNVVIVQPVRLIFIPVIIPIFIPVVYYVPVFITNIIQVYIPYAALQVYIDVYSQELRKPTHTIQYFVYDQTGTPINDATVTVAYNGTVYPAAFIANGIYEVNLPASDKRETITVTAMKDWYPDGILTYDLNVTWVTEVVTQNTPLYILPIIASLAFLAVSTTIIRKRKR